MNTRPILFFAGPEDLLNLLLLSQGDEGADYLLISHRSSDGIFPKWKSADDIPLLGRINTDSAMTGSRFLIGTYGTRWKTRKVKQANGGYLYFADQANNPDTVYLVPGGLHPQNSLIAGTLSTTGATKKSLNMFDRYFTHLQTWKVFEDFFISPEAEHFSRLGYRLIKFGVRQPVTQDLSFNKLLK